MCRFIGKLLLLPGRNFQIGRGASLSLDELRFCAELTGRSRVCTLVCSLRSARHETFEINTKFCGWVGLYCLRRWQRLRTSFCRWASLRRLCLCISSRYARMDTCGRRATGTTVRLATVQEHQQISQRQNNVKRSIEDDKHNAATDHAVQYQQAARPEGHAEGREHR